jgi:hypothetical protein
MESVSAIKLFYQIFLLTGRRRRGRLCWRNWSNGNLETKNNNNAIPNSYSHSRDCWRSPIYILINKQHLTTLRKFKISKIIKQRSSFSIQNKVLDSLNRTELIELNRRSFK